MKVDLMVDLETLSLGIDGALASLGAVVFNYDKPNYFLAEFSQNIDEHKARPMEEGVVRWWMLQSETSRRETFGIEGAPLGIVMDNFLEFLVPYLGNIERVWSKGYMDMLWLKSAFRQLGLEWPFIYNIERDFRTIMDVGETFGILFEKPFDHVAIQDARLQAAYTVQVGNAIVEAQP